jgi:type VI secretion system protein ImpB
MTPDTQHWLSTNRPPRVQITYDVETLGATVKQEIPFIMGVISDLHGDTAPADDMAGRRFVEIDRDNFAQVIGGIAPTRTLTGIPHRQIQRGPSGPVAVPDGKDLIVSGLAFKSLDDFTPANVIQNVSTLSDIMTLRQQLSTLVAQLGTSATLPAAVREAAAPQTFTGATAAITAADAALTGALTQFGTAVAAVKAADSTQGTAADALATSLSTAKTTSYTGLAAAQKSITDWQAAPAVKAKADAAAAAVQALAGQADTVSKAIDSALGKLQALIGAAPKTQIGAVTDAVSVAKAQAVAATAAFAELPAYPGSILALNPSAAA